MTDPDGLQKAFPQSRQVGGSHYKNFHIQPYEFISKNRDDNKNVNVAELTNLNMELTIYLIERVKEAIKHVEKARESIAEIHSHVIKQNNSIN